MKLRNILESHNYWSAKSDQASRNGLTLIFVNAYLANVPILYPLKAPGNLAFSGVFRESKMRILARNGFTHFVTTYPFI